MLKSYELLYIVHPDLEGTIEKVMDKVAGFIIKADGKILSQEDWGKRKLAYKISKNDFGVYVLVIFSVESIKLKEVERNMRLSEEIMRSMIVTLPEEKETKKPVKPRTTVTEVDDKRVEKVEKVAISESEIIDVEKVEKPVKKAIKITKKETKEKGIKLPAAKDRIELAKKSVKKIEKPKKEAKPEDEKARLKKLDEKLEELLK
ncbi:MAG: 30S ribosomal protein S6 [Patescibacteria group bacterium]|jgi:small subunit ribosomal protein S6|nr:30S ribosomal protein S6 [Patescibacteria group bacterium]